MAFSGSSKATQPENVNDLADLALLRTQSPKTSSLSLMVAQNCSLWSRGDIDRSLADIVHE
jgi:hypothetical protein